MISSPDITPATPAIAEPMKKVSAIVRLTSIPSISAASRSEATARIDLPRVVRSTSSFNPIIIIALTTMIVISTGSIRTPPMWIPPWRLMKLFGVVVLREAAEQQQHGVLEQERDAERGDQRRYSWRVP